MTGAPGQGSTLPPPASRTPGQARARRLTRRELGDYGERLAARHLTSLGCEVLARNWRCAHGEIDIVALHAGCLVVCEVKTRSGVGYGEPVEAVSPAKAARLRRLLAAYLAEHPHHGPVRVDVIGVLYAATGPARLRHLVDVLGW